MKQIYYIDMIKREQREDSFSTIAVLPLTRGFYCSQKKAKQEVDYLGDLFVKNINNAEEIRVEKTEVSYSIFYKVNGKTYEQEFTFLPARLDEEED